VTGPFQHDPARIGEAPEHRRHEAIEAVERADRLGELGEAGVDLAALLLERVVTYTLVL
jgi:hypothetical protein